MSQNHVSADGDSRQTPRRPRSVPVLTRAQEIELIVKVRSGCSKSVEEMTIANLRLVHSIARRYQGLGVPLEDLGQEGSRGLHRALELFDHSRGFRFATYATWWIRQFILRSVTKSRRIARMEVSYDAPSEGEDQELPHHDIVAVTSDPAELATNRVALETCLRVMQQVCSDRNYTIMLLRFGLRDGKVHTQEQVAELFGVSRSMIDKIERNTKQKLRHDERLMGLM